MNKEQLQESRDSWLKSTEFYKKDALHSMWMGNLSAVVAITGVVGYLEGARLPGAIAAIGGNVMLLVSQHGAKDSIEEAMVDRARAQERQGQIDQLDTLKED